MKIELPDPEDDIKLWNFVYDVLATLGLEGMSSDVSEFDEELDRVVYHVKVLAWRRDIAKFMDFIDAHRRDALTKPGRSR